MSTAAPESAAATDAGRQAEQNVVAGRTSEPLTPPTATPNASGTQNTAGNAAQKPARPKGQPRKGSTPKGNGNGKATAPKATPAPAPAEDEGLRVNQVKLAVADGMYDANAAFVRSWKKAGDYGCETITQLMELVGSYLSFLPGSGWRIEFIEPQTGRGHKHRLTVKDRAAQKQFIAAHTPKTASRRKAKAA